MMIPTLDDIQLIKGFLSEIRSRAEAMEVSRLVVVVEEDKMVSVVSFKDAKELGLPFAEDILPELEHIEKTLKAAEESAPGCVSFLYIRSMGDLDDDEGELSYGVMTIAMPEQSDYEGPQVNCTTKGQA